MRLLLAAAVLALACLPAHAASVEVEGPGAPMAGAPGPAAGVQALTPGAFTTALGAQLSGFEGQTPEQVMVESYDTFTSPKAEAAERAAAGALLRALGDPEIYGRELRGHLGRLDGEPGTAARRAAEALSSLALPSARARKAAREMAKELGVPASVAALYEALPAPKAKVSPEGEEAAPYDEAIDASGALRPAFAAYAKRTGLDPFQPSAEMIKLATDHPLDDKIKIWPTPLVLAQEEYETRVRAGTAQRLKALMAFFEDAVLGSGRIYDLHRERQRAQVPRELTYQTVEEIFRDQGWNLHRLAAMWDGKSAKDMNLFYGPDLVRNPEGDWVALEDNLTDGVHIGGTGDLHAVHKAFHAAAGTSAADHPSADFFETAVKRFLAKAGLRPGEPGAVAFIHRPDQLEHASSLDRLKHDMETLRKIKILRRLGVEIVDPDRLSIGAFREIVDGKYRAILNIDNPASWGSKAQLFDKVFKKGTSALLASPGVSVLSSKALLPFVDSFIRFYLREEPLIKTQSTVLFPLNGTMAATIEKLQWSDIQDWVLKSAAGLQGRDVHLFKRLEREQKREILGTLADRAYQADLTGAPAPLYVVQKHVEASTIPAAQSPSWIRYYVDLRPLTHALGIDDLFVSPVPWGRTVTTAGTGHNNVSQAAYELPVLIEKSPAR